MNRMLYIAVIGGSEPEEKYKRIAYEVGQKLAEKNVVVLCGGLGGVMEEVSRGVKDGNGTVIGILPDGIRGEENPYLSFTITTGMGYMRNFLIVRSAESVIAIDGSNGSL